MRGGGYMEIYLDIVLIENFVIDMFILLITAKLMHIKHNNLMIKEPHQALLYLY